ncbi:MAG: hypothetical protein IH825_06705 [Candidatus Marinimicrobia bacterium]|nr:hypothetical protein [Candidatus Neomarinimicrobiota bacterium]
MKRLLITALISMAMLSCDDSIVDDLLENLPPVVSVFLLSDTTLNRTSSRQILSWDGRDPDGLVVGFYYTFGNSSNRDNWVFLPDSAPVGPELLNGDSAYWRFTTDRTDTFSLAILTDTITYVFSVLAVDDDNSLSVEPARLVLPIKNSKPEVFFLGLVDLVTKFVKIPDTTYTITSFAWGVEDIDGEETIAKYQYALTSPGDSLTDTVWVDLPPSKKSIILSGTIYETEEDVTFDDRLVEGDHAFNLRAFDVAGAVSDVERLPADPEKYWYVKEPIGDVLIIDDWEIASTDGGSIYKQGLAAHGRAYSVIDLKPQTGEYLLTKVSFVETVKLFKVVLWYADVDPNLEVADAALSKYTERGGKVIFSTLFALFASNQGDPLGFTPVDSFDVIREPDSSSVSKIAKSLNISLWPDSLVSDQFPDTLGPAFLSSIISSPKQLVPKPSARVLYRYQSVTSFDPIPYVGEPVVMIEDASRSFIFASVPLHYFDGNDNLADFIEFLFTQEFGLPEVGP